MFRKSRTLHRLFLAALLILVLSPNAAMAQEEVEQPPVTQKTVIIDINSAPPDEIRGIVLDDLLTRRIIENRPYANKRQLLTRKLVTDEQYEEIKDRIVARRGTPDPEE